jgi:hypothetical protein
MALIVISILCILICGVILIGFAKSIYDDLDKNEF